MYFFFILAFKNKIRDRMRTRTIVRIGAASSLLLGVILIIVSSLNLRMRSLGTNPESIRAGDVFCLTVPETIDRRRSPLEARDPLEQEVETSLRAVALVWTAFLSGILLSGCSIGVLVYTR